MRELCRELINRLSKLIRCESCAVSGCGGFNCLRSGHRMGLSINQHRITAGVS